MIFRLYSTDFKQTSMGLKMKNILFAILTFGISTPAMAADKLSFQVQMSYSSEYGEALNDRNVTDAGWTSRKDKYGEVTYALSEKDLSVAKLPFSSCLGNICFEIAKNKNGQIEAQLGYSDEDNAASGTTVVYPGHANILKVQGHDNSTWSIDGEAVIQFN
jgi:hypothetical protein